MNWDRLNFRSWPIWAKLLSGLMLVIMVPVLLALISFQPGVREIAQQTLRSFLSENGERQRLAVTNTLNQTRGNMSDFLEVPAYRRRIIGLLLNESPLLTDELAVSPTEVNNLLLDVLLVRSTTFYDSVRLLDEDGTLLALGAVDTPSLAVSEPNQRNSNAYTTAQNELAKAQSSEQFLVVSNRSGVPIVELVQIIYWYDRQPIGYLVAELNNQRVFYDSMRFGTSAFTPYSFIAAEDDLLLSPADFAELAAPSTSADGALRALRGEVGVDIYRIPGQNQEVAGYFAPLVDTPLVLVAEAPTAQASAPSDNLFNRQFFIVAIASTAVVVLLLFLLNQAISPPLQRMRVHLQSLMAGNLSQTVADTDRDDEIGQLAQTFDAMQRQIQSLVRDLETRIATRTRDMNATQEISRYAVTQRDLQQLLERVVNLIIERFMDIYHAQIFLMDSDGEYAVLRASTGDVGKMLLERGHRLAVGSVSVIGQVTAQGRVLVARDTATSQVHRRNEFLPDTRAELAIPLRVGEEIIGALDVQSRQRDAFTEDLSNVLQTMADQIAIAIQNARLYEESVRRLEEIERGNRQATERVWREYMNDQRARELTSTAGTESTAEFSELRKRAMRTGQLALGSLTERKTIPIAVPLRLRGQILGAVEWELLAQEMHESNLQLAQELADRLALSLDNARLFEESQAATERERLVNTIASKLTVKTDIDEILQTAVKEVGLALRAPQVNIRLKRSEAQPENGTNGNNGSSSGYEYGNTP